MRASCEYFSYVFAEKYQSSIHYTQKQHNRVLGRFFKSKNFEISFYIFFINGSQEALKRFHGYKLYLVFQ